MKPLFQLVLVIAGFVMLVHVFNSADQQAQNNTTSKPRHQAVAPQEKAAPSRTVTQRPTSTNAQLAARSRQAETASKQEPEWKAVVSDVSRFISHLPVRRLEEEHRKISVTESTLKLHKDAAQFSIGLSRDVELEAMGEQAMHIVQLSDRIIATFRELDRDFARIEQRVKNVSWDSAAERNSQVSRLNDYEDLKRRFLHPAQAMKARYDR
jgi:hypothetical protein